MEFFLTSIALVASSEVLKTAQDGIIGGRADGNRARDNGIDYLDSDPHGELASNLRIRRPRRTLINRPHHVTGLWINLADVP